MLKLLFNLPELIAAFTIGLLIALIVFVYTLRTTIIATIVLYWRQIIVIVVLLAGISTVVGIYDIYGFSK